MFSKEESKQIRQEFWTSFGKSFPKKWLLYNTKIKGLTFKFHFDTKQAYVAMDVEGDLETRIKIWDKILPLKHILQTQYLENAVYNDTHILDNGKEISRVFVTLEEKVSIHNKKTWQTVMFFFNKVMPKFELFFEDYKDLIRP